MSSITNEKIRSINRAIRNTDDSLKLVLGNYKSNIESINSSLNGISFTDWEDDVATKFASYNNYLKTGVVSKLNNSIGTNGSMARLNFLITDLYNKCNAFITNYNSILSKDTSLTEENGHFVAGTSEDSERYTVEQVEQINKRLDEDRDVIESVLKELAALRFDSIIDYDSITSRDINSYGDIEVTPPETKKTTTLVRYDKVLVYIEEFGEEREVYYLGTDSKGRSYFSLSLDNSAKVYRAELPNSADQFSSYLNDVENLAKPGFAEARLGALIMGVDLENVTVKDILSYPNGLYTDDADFNTSITYHDMEYAPEIVERGNESYDPETAYHVMTIDVNSGVSLSDVFDSGSNVLDEHPTIVLKPGESITTKYNIDLGFFELPTPDFMKESFTIGSDTDYTFLVWSSEMNRYYVLNNNSYYTSSIVGGDKHGRGYRYLTISQLRDSSTKVNIK